MMKKFCLLAISLCLICPVFTTPFQALAAETSGITEYPEILSEKLEFEQISDYAAGNGIYAFADGKNITVLENEITTVYSCGKEISALDCSDGVFYYTVKDDTNVYSLPEKIQAEYTMPDFKQDVFSGNYQYFYNSTSGVLSVTDRGATPSTTSELAGFTKIKMYDGAVYVIRENKLYTLNGKEPSEVTLIYSNYDSITRIKADGALNQLSSFSSEQWIVTLHDGVNMTEFDLNRLDEDSEYYPVVSPRQNTHCDITGQALLLCETGKNTGVVAIGSKTYILNQSGYTKLIRLEFTPLENAKATIYSEEWGHSVPYMSNPTRIFKISPTDTLDVLAEVSLSSQPILAHDFYLVNLDTENGEHYQGYVAKEFINLEYPKLNDSDTNVIPDPDERHDNYTRTVVLVLVVIILVLVALGYLTWISTAGKNSGKQKDKSSDNSEIDLKEKKK